MEKIQIQPYSEYKESEIVALYKAVGWKNYYENPEMMRLAYQHSLYVLGAYLNDELVGIIRVVGDGYSIIYIQDIIVVPFHQRKGIGRLLINAVLEKFQNVYQTVLLTDDRSQTVEFYKSIGFNRADEYGCVGFVKFKLQEK